MNLGCFMKNLFTPKKRTLIKKSDNPTNEITSNRFYWNNTKIIYQKNILP